MDELIEKFQETLLSPLGEILKEVDSMEDLRGYLDILNPYKLHNSMVKGFNDFLSDFENYVSSDLLEATKEYFSKLEENARELGEVWDILDEYERTETLNNIDEGLFATEVIWGVALGNALFPGLGGVLGGFLGGHAAGKRVQANLERAIESYSNGTNNYVNLYCNYVKKFIGYVINNMKEKENFSSLPISKSLDDLERLVKMRNSGMITEEEFIQLKIKMIYS